MTRFRILVAAVAVVLLWSCGQGGSDSTEVWQKERDNIVKVEVVSIEDSLPAMHAHSSPILVLGDTIIFSDIQSTELLYAAYDVGTGRFLGWFGRYGAGPGEVANFGGEFLDAKNRIMYGHSFSQWNYSGFELDKAIGDPDYKAFVKVKNPTDESKLPTNCHYYINDTTVIGAVMAPNEDWTAFEFRLGRLDLTTGLTTLLPNPPVEEGARYQIDVSQEHNLIVATGLENDRVNLYDLKGNLKKSIYGANYRPEIRKKRYYNCTPMITDDRIYFVYRRLRQWEYGDDIIELDHDGNYIRTLRTGVPIANMVYHKGTNRIYFGSIADPQFGYIELSKVKDKGHSDEGEAREQEEAKEARVKKGKERANPKIVYSSVKAAGKPAFAKDESRHGPLKMVDGRKKYSGWSDTVAIADVGAYSYDGRRLVRLSYINYSCDTLLIDTVFVPDNRFKVECHAPRMFIPKLLSGIELTADSIGAIDDYRVVISFRNKNIPPQTLHFNIHPNIHKLHADYAASQAE